MQQHLPLAATVASAFEALVPFLSSIHEKSYFYFYYQVELLPAKKIAWILEYFLSY
jgi:hypothetical protein